MGNLCKGQTGVGDNGGKPPSQRNGSGSTSNFSPTDDYHNGDKTGAGAIASRSREAGLGVPESVLERVPRHNHAATAGEVNAKVPSAHVDINHRSDLNTHSAKEGGAAARHGTAGNSGGEDGEGGEDDSGGGHSGESARKARRNSDGDDRSSRNGDGRSRRESKGKSTSKSSKGKKDGSHRRSRGDKGDRKPRPERSDEDKTTKRRDRKSRANGDHETDEDRERREKKDRERRERRKRKEAKAAADMVGGETGVTNGQPSAEQSLADSGIQGSSNGRRESKSSRNNGSDGTDARNNGSGSHGASGVMAGSGASATGGSSAATAVDDRKNKKGPSSFRKQIYDSLTGGFSTNVVGGGGGGGDPAGGGPAGGGGGGGGTTSGKGSKSDRRPGRTQLVTSVTSRDVREKYEIERSQLGHGHYGVVRRCWDKETREGFAIKTIKKSKVSRIESLRREIEILRCVDHPCIIKLYDVYEDDRFIHLVTELCTGGELFDRIIQKTESEEGHYSEKDAKVVVSCILSGIEYCHNEHNICHRDLKPENFLFKRPDCDTDIKIIDFGLSRFEDMQSAMTTRVGTPYYIAPEVLSRKYDKACDLWSIGVITYILLAGYPPFYGESDQEIFASVRHGYFDFPSPEWDSISVEAKDFIRQLLQKDPSARMTATQAIGHRWFDTPPGRKGAAPGGASPKSAGGSGGGATEDKRDKINMQVSMQRINHRLRRFVGMSKLKKVALNVIAQQLTEADIGHLRGVFERLDVQGNGVISVTELTQVVRQEGLECMQEDVARLLQGIDIDGSNSLNYREFLAATMERNIFIREENIRCAFDYFDLDSNSKITLANLVKIFGAEEHAREIMDDVNLSGEGAITYDEFKSMMMEMPLDGRDPLTPRTPRTPFTVKT